MKFKKKFKTDDQDSSREDDSSNQQPQVTEYTVFKGTEKERKQD